jgi:hypothetical protein
MRLSPVRQYSEPQYPTRLASDEHPELLAELPIRWRSNAAILAVLAGASILLAGCGGSRPKPFKEPPEGGPPAQPSISKEDGVRYMVINSRVSAPVQTSYSMVDIESRQLSEEERQQRFASFITWLKAQDII